MKTAKPQITFRVHPEDLKVIQAAFAKMAENKPRTYKLSSFIRDDLVLPPCKRILKLIQRGS